MVSKQLNRSSYRYERKFCSDHVSARVLEDHVKLHPFAFSEIFHQRFINNIYLDTPDYSCFNDNLIGIADRTKYRIRWYGDLNGQVSKPHLELKRKKGLVGDKESYLLPDFQFNKSFNLKDLRDLLAKADLPELIQEKLKLLFPAIINRYSRKYFLSACKNYRITIDSDLQFYSFNVLNSDFFIDTTYKDMSILELKYEVPKDLEAHKITQHIPCRLSKSSKYVLGVSNLISHDLKEQMAILDS